MKFTTCLVYAWTFGFIASAATNLQPPAFLLLRPANNVTNQTTLQQWPPLPCSFPIAKDADLTFTTYGTYATAAESEILPSLFDLVYGDILQGGDYVKMAVFYSEGNLEVLFAPARRVALGKSDALQAVSKLRDLEVSNGWRGVKGGYMQQNIRYATFEVFIRTAVQGFDSK